MSGTNFNLGRDCQVVLMGPFGRVDLNEVTGFSSRQMTKPVNIAPLNGPPQFAEVPDGWEGEFEVDRANSAVDDLASAIESGFWAAGVGVTPSSTLYQYVTEVNGSTSTYQFQGAALKFDTGA